MGMNDKDKERILLAFGTFIMCTTLIALALIGRSCEVEVACARSSSCDIKDIKR